MPGNIAKPMTSNGKQGTATLEILTAVARDRRWPAGYRWNLSVSKFALVLFCHVTNQLMTCPLGNSEFSFSSNLYVSRESSRETKFTVITC